MLHLLSLDPKLTSVHRERGLVHGGSQDRSAIGLADTGHPPAKRSELSISITVKRETQCQTVVACSQPVTI